MTEVISSTFFLARRKVPSYFVGRVKKRDQRLGSGSRE
jgi:hypothetical protein